MRTLWIDLETRSRVDLKKFGAYRYAACPDFQILMASYRLDDGEVVDVEGQDEVLSIPGLLDPDVTHVAHNAAFERISLSAALGLPTDQFLPPHQWRDTQAVGAYLGLPKSLSRMAQAVGADPKDEAGTHLINLFSKPRRDGGWNDRESHPEKWQQFVDYCHQDVVTLVDLDTRLQHAGGMPESERKVWLVDQLGNDRGFKIDVPLARAAIVAGEKNRVKDTLSLLEETNWQVVNPKSVPQMMKWAKSSGLVIENLRTETIDAVLSGRDGDAVTDHHRKVLELRQDLALVAADKYKAGLGMMREDHRVRGTLRYFGAHTGRWSGSGLQPQNMPRLSFKDDESAEAAVASLLSSGEADGVELKKMVRSLILGPLTVVDYSAIEACLTAWVAGETWVMDAIKAGRDIYVETANRMSTANRGKPMGRADGKVAVLAGGYQGGVHSLRNMGAQGTDDEIQVLVDAYRDSVPKIVKSWRLVEQAFREGGSINNGLIRVEVKGNTRRVHLPSGRTMYYRGVVTGRRLSYIDPGRGRTETYGGRLLENIIQALSRDLLAEALVRLHEAGFEVVSHVHDEAVVEGDCLPEMEAVMTQAPEWTKSHGGLPLSADGYVCSRYRKS